MEQVELRLSEFTLRSRSMAVSHRATGLTRGLDPGERVLVRDVDTGHFYGAVAADVDFELDDTVYRVEIGARLSAEEALDWLMPVAPDDGAGLTTLDLLDLLDELRRSKDVLRDLIDEIAH